MPSDGSLVLPNQIVGLRELKRCLDELDATIDEMVATAVKRRTGAEALSPSTLPSSITTLIAANQLTLATKSDLVALKRRLQGLVKQAPRFRFTLVAEPSDQLLVELVAWLRKNINPTALIDVRVSPHIGGGFILQTPLRRYDASWRTRLGNAGNRFAELLQAERA